MSTYVAVCDKDREQAVGVILPSIPCGAGEVK